MTCPSSWRLAAMLEDLKRNHDNGNMGPWAGGSMIWETYWDVTAAQKKASWDSETSLITVVITS